MVEEAGARLYILAMDHRGSFEKDLFGFEGPLSASNRARVSDAKDVIYESLLQALEQGAPRQSAGVLVDEEFGAGIARAAHTAGVILAMPVEKSGQEEFFFDYGDEWRSHIEAFDPDFVKVLVRYNPDGNQVMNARQSARLRELSEWLRGQGQRLLFELLVPPTHEELEEAGGVDSYDHSLRPDLVVRAIAELQQAGVQPAVWKIEGIDRREDCVRVAAQARTGGHDEVRCIVLGRGADQERVEAWLRQAAGADGYAGFAIGRTIWFDALKTMLSGEINRDEARSRVAGRYLRAIEVYETAAGESA
jgi:myo-inositol catabolism protein IolC